MTLDIIIPIFNKEKQIINIYNKINEELKSIKHNFIFIDNFSTDKSLQVLKELYKEDDTNIKIISLSKYHKKNECIYAGIENSKHDLVCIYDLDLNANTSHILKMYELITNHDEYDEVCMYANTNIKGSLRRNLKLVKKIFNLDIDLNKTYFRMFKRNVLNAIIDNNKYYGFSNYTFDIIGFNVYYSKFECKNSLNDVCLKRYFCYIKSPFKFINLINYFLLLFTFIITVLSILKVFTISNNILLILLLLLVILLLLIMTFSYNYLLKFLHKTNYIVREKIGFDENVL